jgi:hypothetical protein
MPEFKYVKCTLASVDVNDASGYTREKMVNDASGGSPADLRSFFAREIEKWRKVVSFQAQTPNDRPRRSR